MTERIIIGNCISFVACVFLAISCVVKDSDRTYLFQLLETGVTIIAAFFFGSWSGLSTLVLSMVRNILVWKNRYKKWHMILLVILLIGVGLAVNNRGAVGLMPIVATVEITFGNYFARRIIRIKEMILVNTLIWGAYSYLIMDYTSAVIDAAVCVISIISIIVIYRDERGAGKVLTDTDRRQ